MSETEDEGFLAELRASNSMKFWGNNQPLCPHCGAEYDISRNDHWSLYDDKRSARGDVSVVQPRLLHRHALLLFVQH